MICKRIPNNIRSKPYYIQYAKNYTSQHGEDGIIEFLFQCIYETANLKEVCNGYCIDIGAWDGRHWSNTYNLIHDCGWKGFLIEANEQRCQSMQEFYASRIEAAEVICLNTIADCQGEQSLLNLLTCQSIPKNPSFVTIDIDGADYHLWENMSGEYSADIVCVEFNPSIQNDIYFIQPPDIRIQKGSSLLALQALGSRLGYVLVACTTFNAIFVHQRHLHKLPYLPNQDNLDEIHTPTMITEMFQTYDGELIYVGTKKLLWHEIALNPQQLQILSKNKQKFPFSPYEVQIHQELVQFTSTCLDCIDKLASTVLNNKEQTENEKLIAGVDVLMKLLLIPSFHGLTSKSIKQIFAEIRSLSRCVQDSRTKFHYKYVDFSGIWVLLDRWIHYSSSLIPVHAQLAVDQFRLMFDAIYPWVEIERSIQNGLRWFTLYCCETTLSLIRCYRLLEDEFYHHYWLEVYLLNYVNLTGSLDLPQVGGNAEFLNFQEKNGRISQTFEKEKRFVVKR